MSECENKCSGNGDCKKKDFWGWWTEKEKTFTVAEVKDLLDRINQFNCGAVDAYMVKHVDKVFVEWSESLDD